MDDVAPIRDFKFFFGGNATFTVDNGKGKHYTFKVRRKEANDNFQNEVFFLSVMWGTDNENDYRYMGVLKYDGIVRLTRGSKVSADDNRLKVAQWAIKKVLTGTELPDGYAIMHAGRCCKCGRKLTNPASIENGVGPECAKTHFS